MTGESVLLADPAHRVDVDRGGDTGIEEWLQLIRAEYLEMPGLNLTKKQAQRLWNLDAGLCEALLDVLITDQFLKQTPGGSYALADDGPH